MNYASSIAYCILVVMTEYYRGVGDDNQQEHGPEICMHMDDESLAGPRTDYANQDPTR